MRNNAPCQILCEMRLFAQQHSRLTSLQLKGLREGQVSDQAAETLQAVELEEKGDNLPHELSGGMKRRLSIALAIVSNPKVLTEEFSRMFMCIAPTIMVRTTTQIIHVI